MKTWSITEARANVASVFDAALKQGPQRIQRRDGDPVVVVAESDWRRLTEAYPTVADLILDAPLDEDDLPPRGPARVSTRGEP